MFGFARFEDKKLQNYFNSTVFVWNLKSILFYFIFAHLSKFGIKFKL